MKLNQEKTEILRRFIEIIVRNVPKSVKKFDFNYVVESLAVKSLITKINTAIVMNRFVMNNIVFSLDDMDGYEKVLIVKYEKILETDSGMMDVSEREYIKAIIGEMSGTIYEQIINEVL